MRPSSSAPLYVWIQLDSVGFSYVQLDSFASGRRPLNTPVCMREAGFGGSVFKHGYSVVFGCHSSLSTEHGIEGGQQVSAPDAAAHLLPTLAGHIPA